MSTDDERDPDAPEPEREEERVFRHRFLTALEAGVSEPRAETFAAGTGPISTLCQMIREGCAPDLAAKILT